MDNSAVQSQRSISSSNQAHDPQNTSSTSSLNPPEFSLRSPALSFQLTVFGHGLKATSCRRKICLPCCKVFFSGTKQGSNGLEIKILRNGHKLENPGYGELLYPSHNFMNWNATYESLLGTSKPFPQPIPLSEMIEFLVDVWEQDGLFD
ncbi:hypothetical protein FNV43_RR12297 [Rhamnella rubrinervis]|uniref:Gag1-like clamp domain-containing protein n=1 Tax=Rhamnella rubrinervis TaxID=2594499 RepID=A0A8K0H788_9ROSA|nr:hypothetical protein FNV43_RR12297 [Rhamnella rubrinervis]